jgi:hypothetical protein
LLRPFSIITSTDAIYVILGRLKLRYTISTLPTTLIALSLWLCSPCSAQEWVEAGWQQVSANHEHQALELWQQGINQLDDKRLLASIGVYAHFPYAIAQLKQVGPTFGTFIARRQQHGKTLYFVLSMRQTSADRKKRQIELADLKQAAGISGILIAAEAGTFKPLQKSTALAPAGLTTTRKTFKPVKVSTAETAISFSINRFEVNGNNRVSNDVILMGLSDFYGSGKTRSDLQSIKNQVLEIYRMSGIYTVRVSTPQLVDDDTIRITIREK